jgi:hypothetical protein
MFIENAARIMALRRKGVLVRRWTCARVETKLKQARGFS